MPVRLWTGFERRRFAHEETCGLEQARTLTRTPLRENGNASEIVALSSTIEHTHRSHVEPIHTSVALFQAPTFFSGRPHKKDRSTHEHCLVDNGHERQGQVTSHIASTCHPEHRQLQGHLHEGVGAHLESLDCITAVAGERKNIQLHNPWIKT